MNNQAYIDFIKYCLAEEKTLPLSVREIDWKDFFGFCSKQAILGVVLEGMNQAVRDVLNVSTEILLEWIGTCEMIRHQNSVLNKQCEELQRLFAKGGFNSCILKGQGNARMYPNPAGRMPGDIDIWIDGEKEEIKKYVHSIVSDAHSGYKDVAFQYKGTSVEAHFIPSYLNNFKYNKRYQKYIAENRERQFANKVQIDDGVTISVPTDDFNVIYQMAHLYHHFFCEGIGMRQFIDYFYILKREYIKSKQEEVRNFFKVFGMESFAKGVMWIEKEILGLERQYLIVEPDERLGQLFFKEMLTYGNFNNENMIGKSATRVKISNTFRPFRYLLSFPAASMARIFFTGWLQVRKIWS